MKLQTFMRVFRPGIILDEFTDEPTKNRNIPAHPPVGTYAVQFFDRDVAEISDVKRADDHNFSPRYMWGTELRLEILEKEIKNDYKKSSALNSLITNMKLFKADRACKTILGHYTIMRPGDLAFKPTFGELTKARGYR